MVYVLPNLFTTANLFCGFLAILSAYAGNFQKAAFLIVAATIFDMMDGRVARLTRSFSRFGMEYDSLCDFVSFGIAPAVLLHKWVLINFGRLGFVIAFLYVVAGALRLARFNVNSSVIKSNFFQGLPIPIAALTISSMFLLHQEIGLSISKNYYVFFMTLLLAFMMVSNLKFRTYKDFNLTGKKSFSHLLAAVLVLIIILINPEITVFLLCAYYISSGLVYTLIDLIKKTSNNRNTKNILNKSESKNEKP